MKFLVLFAIIGWVAAAVEKPVVESLAPIVKSSYDINAEDGSFVYSYETGNGIFNEAVGVVKDPKSEHPTLEVKGSFKYYSPDGVPVEMSYISNEGGFQAVGSHIPVPPPVPEMILRSLKYIEDHPAPVKKN